MIIYYSSKNGNTKRFVENLGLDAMRIEKGLIVDYPFVLIIPTYARNDGSGSVPKPVIEFLNHNHKNIIGVAGSGNRNFGKQFAMAADVVALKCKVPLIHKFELFGTNADLDIVKGWIGAKTNEETSVIL